MTVLVILGAGASYDYTRDIPVPTVIAPTPASDRNRPPLTMNLFDAGLADDEATFLALIGAEALDIRRRLAGGSGDTIEVILAEYADAAAAGSKVAARTVVRVKFHLQELMTNRTVRALERTRSATNYAWLAREVAVAHEKNASERTLFVSFNYDELLEDALTSYRLLTIGGIDGYLGERVALLKPHGSINWWREVPAVTSRSRQRARHLLLDDPPIAIELGDVFVDTERHFMVDVDGRGGGEDIYPARLPAIAVPVSGKRDSSFEWPDAQRARLLHELPAVDRVLVIGWHGAEEHFWDLLETGGLPSSAPVLTMCAGDVDPSRRFRDRRHKTASSEAGTGGLTTFTDFVNHGGYNDFLKHGTLVVP